MKLTPLNIALACVLVWAISELGNEGEPLFSWVWLVVLSVLLVFVDILFRVWVRDIQRLWVMQIGFMIIVGIVTVLIKIQF
ncbi:MULTISPECIES: hypothetical protein [unclassified Sphingobacterium]|uniref:hypothetical protein n=1 Tax=unclassified Sphingobacterium TaxID=2609468 RepID=UPI00265CC8CD|nr:MULTISPECIES: hypothetical protein [unclassified Sphingobacterium]WKK59156.1 hypothetical protein QYC40_02750 [Sphingobacterium sp. BN32]